MTEEHVRFAVTILLVTVDNALLAGLFVTFTDRRRRLATVTIAAISLALIQTGMAIGIGQLLQGLIYRALAIVILGWMCIRTMNHATADTQYRMDRYVWLESMRMLAITVFGNLDNMIWLGATFTDHYDHLAFLSLVSIPLFIGTAVLLSEQSARHRWILFVGSGMMAWSAGNLYLGMPWAEQVAGLPDWMIQSGIAMVVIALGFAVRLINRGSAS